MDQWKSGSFEIYKSLGAAQISLKTPQRDERGWVTRDGCIFITVAPGVDKQQWDWTKKITFALGINDICLMMGSPEAPPKLIHDLNGTLKTLFFKPGVDKYEGTFMLQISQSGTDEKLQISVPFTAGEYAVLLKLIGAAVPMIVGWFA